jgi:hypothetical protein
MLCHVCHIYNIYVICHILHAQLEFCSCLGKILFRKAVECAANGREVLLVMKSQQNDRWVFCSNGLWDEFKVSPTSLALSDVEEGQR